MAPTGEPGPFEEQLGIGGRGRVDASGRDLDRVVAPARAVSLDPVGVIEQQPPAREHRHPGAEELAVQGVRERDHVAPPVGTRRQQA